MNQKELIQEKADFIKNSSQEINNITSLDGLYQLIDKMNDAVKIFYPHIGCASQCFLCCQHSNIPLASSVEWEKTHSFIKNSSEKFKKDLIENISKLFKTHGSYLKKLHFVLNSDDDQLKLKELSSLLPQFKGNSCLFLKEGFCTVYDGRPSKCRTQGYSLMEYGDSVQFQTCVPEVIRMEEYLTKIGSRKVLMPKWNDYEVKIKELSQGKTFIISVLPVWVYVHIQNDSFSDELNINPDFEKILIDF